MKQYFYRIFLLIPLCILGLSCSTAIQQRGEYIAAFHYGDLRCAESTVSNTICKETPRSNDASWLLLDRATIRFIEGNINGAIDDYRQAIDLLDHYNQSSLEETIGALVLQDDLGAYSGEDFEQILARVYLGLALIHKGDLSNAFAVLRQAEELQQKIREQYHHTSFTRHYQLVDNALGKYLFAALLEKRGDASNADILYRQTEQLVGNAQVQRDCYPSIKNSEQATVIIVCHNGNVPYKISAVTDASIASGILLELILGANNVQPAISSVGGIPVPALEYNLLSDPIPTYAALDRNQKPLLPIYPVGTIAFQQLEQKMPVIVARGVARFAMRRGAVAYAQERDPALGAFVDIGMLIANLRTKADTRSWTTLPDIIDIARFDVNAGFHDLALEIVPSGCAPAVYNYQIHLKPEDLCIINVFNIHPGVTSVQIPERFLDKKTQ